VGITSAFLSTGTHYVISSLWEVDQTATVILLSRFYELVGAGSHSVLEALNAAQRSLAKMTREEAKAWFDTHLVPRAPKPVLRVEPHQDKIRMEHYVPLHPQVTEAVQPLLNGRQDDELMFHHGSFWMWVKRQKIPMSQFKGHFVLGDLRKFAEQYGDTIQWDQSNRAYIMTHGVSGIDWSHYKRPLPEHVYDVYMKYWRDTRFAIS
jgi:hypothetical protein